MDLRLLAVVSLIAAGIAGPAAAQKPLHTVVGVVLDGDANPLVGVEVLLDSPERRAATNRLGIFRLDSVPEGKRRIVVRRIGYLAVHPTVTVPQAPGDTVHVILLRTAQELEPIIVQADRPGIRGVVGDTGYRALPGTVVELLGARRGTVTDDRGRFAFENLKQGQYMLRISRKGYRARIMSVNLTKTGQEYSIFLNEFRPGAFDWANSHEAVGALTDLSIRLAPESHWNRMTRAELERYGTMALCDIPRLRIMTSKVDPSIVMRGTAWIRGANLCGWNADQIDLIEWGPDPCKEAWKSIADLLGVNCGPQSKVNLFSTAPAARGPWFILWPRG